MSVIGKMTKSRGSWNGIKPVTKVVPDKKTVYKRKEKHKKDYRAGE